MKSLSNWKKAAWVVGISLFCLFYFIYAFAPFDSAALTLSYDPATGKYTVGNLHSMDNDAKTPEPQYRIFVNTGDGNYLAETIPNSALGTTRSYTLSGAYFYNATGTFNAYAEATELYDVNTPANIPNPMVLNNWLEITSTRQPVPGDAITFIVSYANTNCTSSLGGNITLTYDPNLLETITNSAGAFVEGRFDGPVVTNNSSNNGNTISVPFNNLSPGEKRHVFFLFKTKDNAVIGSNMNPTPRVDASFTGSGTLVGKSETCIFSQSVSNIACSAIVEGHDPNFKTAAPDSICNGTQKMEYTIHFQNDGYGPVSTIEIVDELHYAFGNTLANIPATAKVGKTMISGIYLVQQGGKKYKCTLQNQNLKGLHQPGFGSQFSEADTKGWLKFYVDIPANYPNDHPCNAVVNQATIYFGCNPPIQTKPVITPIKCLACSNCTTVTDSIQTVVIPNIVNIPYTFPMSGTLSNSLDSDGFQDYKWYPATGMLDPTVKIPTFLTTPEPTIYTLVASNSPYASCTRRILQFDLRKNCNLEILVDAKSDLQTGPCTDSKDGFIDAQVSGGQGPYTWSNCANGSSAHFSPLEKGFYLIGVTDAKGCTAEKWVEIKGPDPMYLKDNPKDCKADLQVVNGTPPFTYQWKLIPAPATLPTGPVINNLKPYTLAQVTVTDANGCTATMTMQKFCKGKIINQEVAFWAFAALLPLLAWLAYKWYKKRKN
jgi:hypothetical protein